MTTAYTRYVICLPGSYHWLRCMCLRLIARASGVCGQCDKRGGADIQKVPVRLGLKEAVYNAWSPLRSYYNP